MDSNVMIAIMGMFGNPLMGTITLVKFQNYYHVIHRIPLIPLIVYQFYKFPLTDYYDDQTLPNKIVSHGRFPRNKATTHRFHC